MLEKKITSFNAGGKEIPIICTFNVLEYLQEEYKTLQNFQRRALGLVENGQNEAGEPQYKNGTIEIKALLDGAAAMINEGIAITGTGEPITRKDVGILLSAAGLTISEVSVMVVNELIRCIEPKKSGAAQKENRKTLKSILRGFFTLEKHFSIIPKKK